jgi:hypothetical protein
LCSRPLSTRSTHETEQDSENEDSFSVAAGGGPTEARASRQHEEQGTYETEQGSGALLGTSTESEANRMNLALRAGYAVQSCVHMAVLSVQSPGRAAVSTTAGRREKA